METDRSSSSGCPTEGRNLLKDSRLLRPMCELRGRAAPETAAWCFGLKYHDAIRVGKGRVPQDYGIDQRKDCSVGNRSLTPKATTAASVKDTPPCRIIRTACRISRSKVSIRLPVPMPLLDVSLDCHRAVMFPRICARILSGERSQSPLTNSPALSTTYSIPRNCTTSVCFRRTRRRLHDALKPGSVNAPPNSAFK